MSESFVVDRSLLNPKFEGYKLDLIQQEKAVKRYDLRYRATQATTSAGTFLSFQDVQSRITYNHLCVSNAEEEEEEECGCCALYVDVDYNVVVIQLDSDELEPDCRVVYELPRPIYSSAAAAAATASDSRGGLPLYPSAAFLDPRTVFVSDGHGDMYVLDIPRGQSARLLGHYRFQRQQQQQQQPFRIHNAVTVSPDRAVVLLSSRHFPEIPVVVAESTDSKKKKRPLPEYDVCAVQFMLPFGMIVEGVQDLDVIWQRRGEDVPLFTAFDKSRKRFLLIASSLYREVGTLPPCPSYEPSTDEIAPIPRKDENLDANPEKPPPYSWTQTSDSVTVAFPLPSNTPKTSIKVTFTPHKLTLHVQGTETTTTTTPSLPHYSLKPFWDGIQPSSSFWTWDREAEQAYGLLTLHLDKQHEGTRWMQVFSTAGIVPSSSDDDAMNPEDVEVPETLDPSELGRIRETLEKYTASLRDGSDTSGLGLGKGVPSLAEGEMDDEVDASVGREVYITPVDDDDTIVSNEPSALAKARVKASDIPPPPPFVLLSTPLPGSHPTHLSLVVKTGLDGAFFLLDPQDDSTSADGNVMRKKTALHWSHTATYSALAFVLASKRDTRFTHHVGPKTVLAFESGSGGRGGNVYIYLGTRTGEKWAKQSVVKVGDAASGSLLGVGALEVGKGRQIILCMTENQLVLIQHVI